MIPYLSVLELKDLCTLEMSIVDDIYEAFSSETSVGASIFARIIKRSLLEWDRRRPPNMYKIISLTENNSLSNYYGNVYTFSDNFDKYVNGEIEESEIELIPSSIGYVKVGRNFISPNYWEYKKPNLFLSMGYRTVGVRFFHRYKFIYNFAPDGEFTSDSKIYFLDNSDDAFVNLVSYVLLRVIKATRDSISLNQIELFPMIDNLIQEYAQERNDSFDSDLTLLKLWRK